MSDSMVAESAVLFYREGSSDKIYQLQLQPDTKTAGWVVNFQYGRRGSTLTEGTKTQKPVDFEVATKVFRAAITQKKAKGYTEDTSGKVFAMSHNEENNTGIVPQLLNNIEEHDINAYIANNNFMMQQKFDGKRMMICMDSNGIKAINRRGLTCGFPDVIKEALLDEAPVSEFLLDGECVGEEYFAFDLLEYNGKDIRSLGARDRYDLLLEHFEGISPNNFQVVKCAMTPKNKRIMLDKVREDGNEGIVLKHKDAPYKPGRPNKLGDQLKFKFVATADVIVTAVNDKRSVAMAVYPDGRKADQQLINIGNCTIPPNHEIPKVDDVIEVRYLYAYPNGALYQPIYLGPRTDKEPYSCKVNQLKYKAGTEDEE